MNYLKFLLFVIASSIAMYAANKLTSINNSRVMLDRVIRLEVSYPIPDDPIMQLQAFLKGYKRMVVTGSAVLKDPSGIAITAAHVVAKPGYTRIIGVNRYGKRSKCSVLRYDLNRDLALVACEGFVDEVPTLEIAKYDTIGDSVIAYGYPSGKYLHLTKGLQCAKLKDKGKLITSCIVAPGMSGGPVYNQKGELISIIQMTYIVLPFSSIGSNTEQIAKFLNRGKL